MLYHVSFEDVEEFVPKIPEQQLKAEDSSIKRICFAKSIRGALTAMPESYYALKGMMKLKKIPPLIHVYSIDENTVDFKDTYDIEQYVLDAEYTEECWVLNTLTKNDYIHEFWYIEDYHFIKKFILDKTYINVLDVLKMRKATDEEIQKYVEVWDDIRSKLNDNEISRRSIYSFAGSNYEDK